MGVRVSEGERMLVSMGQSLREIAAPFVVAPPAGRRIRTRLRPTAGEERALWALGAHLGSLAGRDLTERCRLGRGDAQRARRKQELTAESSSRWAGAITRTSNDQWQRAWLNLLDRRRGLRRALATIDRRLSAPVGGRNEKTGVHGYASRAERFHKQQRRQILAARLAAVDARIAEGRVSVVRGGRRLASTRHHLKDARLTEREWRERWHAERMFITADGERCKRHGNETIRIDPTTGIVEVKLPGVFAEHASVKDGRLRLAVPVAFRHRADKWAAQAQTGAVRYDIVHDPDRKRWYLDASWRIAVGEPVTVAQATRHGVLALDLNAGHLACCALESAGNPTGQPFTVPIVDEGATGLRDASIRHAISTLIHHAKTAGVQAIAVENLNFVDARDTGRETMGRGKRGKRFRKTVAGLPTARFRDRLAHMCASAGLRVIAVDPAYTSRWGAQHWQRPISTKTFKASRHHAASVTIGRRARGLGVRRGRRRDLLASGASPRESCPGRTPSTTCAPAPRHDGKATARHPKVRKTRLGDPATVRGSPPSTVRSGR